MTGTNYAEVIYSKYGNDVSMLENILKEYPVSSLSQFLLLYHYKKNDDPAFETLARQTALYFNNPAWLQFQLSQNDVETKENGSGLFDISHTGHFAVVLPEETRHANEENQEKIFDTSSKAETEIYEPEIKTSAAENEEEILSIEKEISHSNVSAEINNNLPAEENSFVDELEIEGSNDVSVIEDESIVEEETMQTEEPEFSEKFAETGEEVIPVESKEEITDTTNDIQVNENREENVAFEPKEETLETDEIKNNAPFKNETGEAIAFDPPQEITEEVSPTSNNETLISEEKIEDEVAFEPLYTVDYFASQGIKMKEELLTNDKLGKQMKSFTDWLKSMKKLHPGKLPEQNEVIEKIIQSSAEESNADAEVLTEAMAEVLIKQNKQEKAIEMYEKLSLMNPSKSAYFAAKIESIKTN